MTVQVSTVFVVVAADDNYVPHVGAMLHSLFSSNATLTFHIDFLHRPAISQDSLERLNKLCAENNAGFYAHSVSSSQLPQHARFDKTYPEEAWYRLILPSLLPQRQRVLWLDADTLVLSEVASLWACDLRGQDLAAVPNALSWRRANYAQGIGVGVDAKRYFSTGVMLMDLDAMRSNHAEQRLAESLKHAPSDISWADQDVFNPVYAQSYRPLPLRWNLTSGAYYFVRENLAVHGWSAYLAARAKPSVVHFTIPWMKPWHHGVNHPYAELYWEHRQAAGWPPAEECSSLIMRRTWWPIWMRATAFALRRRQLLGAALVLAFQLRLLFERTKRGLH